MVEVISLLFAATVFTASQGSAVRVEVPGEAGVVWQGKRVPAFRSGGGWTTILGVDLDTKPGAYHAGDEITIDVVAKKFPTSRVDVDDRYVNLSKADLERSARESKETDAIYERITTDVVPDEAFTDPIPGVKGTNFGERRIFNGEPRAPHGGADLHATAGTPVHATNRGRVVLAKNLFFTGNTVILDHGLGIYSLYAHLSRIDVKAGETVTNGQVVGRVGATGRVTAPHLHWGMRVQGARVNPFSLVGR
jgi:murein DD-endopeptidase MepM/ murein hydrolase activator NlpD